MSADGTFLFSVQQGCLSASNRYWRNKSRKCTRKDEEKTARELVGKMQIQLFLMRDY